jgi:hypothetical protein
VTNVWVVKYSRQSSVLRGDGVCKRGSEVVRVVGVIGVMRET